jgi:thiol-disulfide isomerase/thioredoxin
MRNFIFVIVYLIFFSSCVQLQYTILLNKTKKIHNFSISDTTICTGGFLADKENYFFIGYKEFKDNKYISFGNVKDSFIYVVNTLTYYSARSTLNIGGELQQYPEKKREFVKLNDKIYKILLADKSKITLQKVKKTIEVVNVFKPFLQLSNFNVKSIKNDSFNLLDFTNKNKFILISVWTSWCPPCIESMPILDSLAIKYNDKLQIISLNCGDEYSDFKKYANSKNLFYGKIDRKEYEGLNGFGFPYYALFNSQGELISYHSSIKNYNWIISKIR